VLDSGTCPVGMTWTMIRFFARESCGFCTPCWSGLAWAERILKSMEDGRGKPADMDTLTYQAGMWKPGNTFCALAPGAADPLQTAMRYFREDFERHITGHRCPWK
jgi:NADH-quinone oxidoreductase subunit F